MEDTSSCYLCGAEGGARCGVCSLVHSCPAHLSQHLGQGQGCLAWRVEHRPDKGRVMVAVRDIPALGLVIQDSPVGLAPIVDSEPMCLQCFRLLAAQAKVYTCQCGFQLCSEECSQGNRHRAECRAYTGAGKIAGKASEEYPLVMPIRVFAQIKEEEGLEERLERLMDHREEREEETENWARVQTTIVAPLLDLGVSVSAAQVQRYVGIIRTNGCQIRGTGVGEGEEYIEDRELGRVRALFPTMASMSHSCLANTRMFHIPGYKMVFRAVREVSAGEELTLSYLPLGLGCWTRRNTIRRNWFFDCGCERCGDPTDLGWGSDSWMCGKCGGEALPVLEPQGAPEQGVLCVCGWGQTRAQVDKLENSIDSLISAGPNESSEQTREWAESVLGMAATLRLGPHHHLVMTIKQRLMECGANTQEQLQRKAAVCGEVLAMLAVLQPGLTDTRGLALYQLASSRGLLLQAEMEQGQLSPSHFAGGLGEILQDLYLAAKCLGVENPGTYARVVGEKAAAAALTVRELRDYAQGLCA